MTPLPTPVGPALLRTGSTTVLILACGVATGLIAARTLGPAARGELAAIVAWATTLVFAASFGLPEAVAYYTAADRGARNRIWTAGQIGAVIFGLTVGTVGWFAIPLVFPPDEGPLGDAIRWYLLLFSVPYLGFACAASWLQGAGLMHAYNVSRLAPHLLPAIAMAVLALAGSRSIAHFAATTIIGTTVGWVMAGWAGPVRRIAQSLPDAGLSRKLLHYGARVQVGNWSNAANLRLDQLLLSLFAPAASLGLYVVAVSYANMLMTIPLSGSIVMLPQMVRENAEGTGRQCLERWHRRMLWATLPAAGVIALSSIIIVPAAFGGAFEGAVSLVWVLVWAAAILGMNDILGTAFYAIGRPDIASKGEVFGLVVTVVLLAALLPRYGVYGAAIASLLAYGSVQVYLTRQAIVVFGTGMRALCVPMREDLAALRREAQDLHQRMTSARRRSVRAEEL